MVVRTAGNVTGEISPSGLKNGGQDSILTCTDAIWTKVERSGASTPTGSGILTGRNSLKITNKSNVDIVTTINDDPNGDSQTDEVGDVILSQNSQFLDVAEKDPLDAPINIWVRSTSGNAIVFFREIA